MNIWKHYIKLFLKQVFNSSPVFFTATELILVSCRQSKTYFSGKICWVGNTSPSNQKWEFGTGRWDKFTVNIPVPHAGLLESQLYVWYRSQECRVKQLHWEQVFLHLFCLLRGGFHPSFTISGRGCISVGLYSYRLSPSLLRVDLQLYLIQVNKCIRELSHSTILAGHQFHFLHQPQPIGNSGGCVQMLLGKADLLGGAAVLVHHRCTYSQP